MSETEIERLVVRLGGDSTLYKQMCADAIAVTQTASAQIVQSLNQVDKTAKMVLPAVASEIQTMSMRLQSAGTDLQIFGAIFASVFAGVAYKSIMSAGKFEQTTVAFETMLGSASEAKDMLSNLTKFAAETPFEMPEIEVAAKGLVQFGERGEELMNTLKIVGNAASGTSTDFGMVALVFNQIRGVGHLMTQDFRQLSTRGIMSLQDIAKHFKLMGTEAEKAAKAQHLISEGKVSFMDVRQIFEEMSAAGGRFANMMEKQSQTFLGLLSTLKDNINLAFRSMGEAMLPYVNPLLKFLNDFTKAVTDLPGPVKVLAGNVTGFAATLGVLATALGGVALAIVAVKSALVTVGAVSAWQWLGYAAKASGGLLGILGPGGIILGLIGLGILAFKAGEGLRNLAVWMGNNTKAAKEFNAQLEKSDRLHQQLMVETKFRDAQELQQGQGMVDKPRREFFEARAQEAGGSDIGLMKRLHLARHQVNDLKQAWGAMFNGNEIKEAEQQVKHLEEQFAQAKRRSEGLRKELMGTIDPIALQSGTKALKELIATMGMKPHDAAVVKMRMQGAKDFDPEFEKFKKFSKDAAAAEMTYKVRDLNHELVIQRQTLNMTSEAAHIYKLQMEAAASGIELNRVQLFKWAVDAKEFQKAQLANSIKDITMSLREQIVTYEMTNNQKRIFNELSKGAKPEDLKEAEKAARQLQIMDIEKENMNIVEKVARKKFELNKLMEGQTNEYKDGKFVKQATLDIVAYNKELEKIEAQAHKDYTVNFDVSGVDAVRSGSKAAMLASAESELANRAIPKDWDPDALYRGKKREATTQIAPKDPQAAGPAGKDAQGEFLKDKATERDKANKVINDILTEVRNLTSVMINAANNPLTFIEANLK